MGQAQLTSNNHYVPRSYLKRWGDHENKISVYRTLVKHENTELWKRFSVKSVAFQKHLYTRLIAGSESDDIENWFESTFETPATESVDKAISGSYLEKSDWHNLICLLAAQDLRTPTRFFQYLTWCSKELPDFITESLPKLLEGLEKPHNNDKYATRNDQFLNELFPDRLTITPDKVIYEIQCGRQHWLLCMKRLLDETASVLLQHKWTILLSPSGVDWLTSDDPVIRLNYQSPEKYNFDGGWANPGTEIFMPISPKHLMYTKVGHRPPSKGTVLTMNSALAFQKLIVQHAHRCVFGRAERPEVTAWKPRIVDNFACKKEKEYWEKWHQIQSTAENDFLINND
ncbi:DUF4238 domain-containing protein [Uliginosibacterium gangwonense]|uniref:DUF4238 domain-containing protein n=1 Tax=Uliginosibacterium gangwonense TaxID=392736 RepID=UPI000374F6D5|nr:DUF4238 domain-containing protein [Uliginosibacterium gangwonense]